MGYAAAAIRLCTIDVRKEAVLTGLMVRLCKLYDCSILLLVKNRMEIALILLRSLVDTP
jgi:hypothetical protein